MSMPEPFPKVQLRRLFEVVNGATPESQNPLFWEGDVPWVTPEDLSNRTSPEIVSTRRTLTQEGYSACGTRLVPPGSIVLSTRAPIGNIGLAGVTLCTNQGCKSLVAKESRIHPRYFYYQLSVRAMELNAIGKGTTFLELSTESLSAISLWCPSLPEQERIANFLDEQTARIDALIAEKTQLSRSLDELRDATIAASVLGSSLGGPRRDTGLVELGEIPASWDVTPLMRLTDPARPIMYGIVLPGPNVEEGPGVPIVKGGDVRPHRLKVGLLNRTTPEIEAPYARARLRANDIVYSIRGTIGDAELVPDELTGANITQDVARIAPREGIHERWLLYAVKSRPVFAQLEQQSLGAAVRGINIFDLKRARIPTPPYAEQMRIAYELDRSLDRMDQLRTHCLVHIAHLREYRSSLISAAVTGKLNIEAYQSKVPEPA